MVAFTVSPLASLCHRYHDRQHRADRARCQRTHRHRRMERYRSTVRRRSRTSTRRRPVRAACRFRGRAATSARASRARRCSCRRMAGRCCRASSTPRTRIRQCREARRDIRLLTVGRDLVGNVEAIPTVAQQTATVTDCGPFDLRRHEGGCAEAGEADREGADGAQAGEGHDSEPRHEDDHDSRPRDVGENGHVATRVFGRVRCAGTHATRWQAAEGAADHAQPKATLPVVFDLVLGCANDPGRVRGTKTTR